MGMSQLEGEFAHYCLVSPQCQSSSECGAGEVGLRLGNRKKSSLGTCSQKHREAWAFPVLMLGEGVKPAQPQGSL